MGLVLLLGCGPATAPAAPDAGADLPPPDPGGCIWDGTSELPYLSRIGCPDDVDALASEPLDASIPGARSIKTVIDRVDPAFAGDPAADGFPLYFQNSQKYLIHWDFASQFLSGKGKPPVPPLGQFNTTEYYSPDRRFLLGAVTYYEGPAVWVYEISPYDTATAEMIAVAYASIAARAYFGEELRFHPTSEAVAKEAQKLPATVKQISTDQLFAGIDYQPLNLGTTTGLLVFHKASEVDGTYTPFRELVVLDAVPNDISIVAGIITAEFQTPLAHINVLSANRGTPNMGLRKAQGRPDLVALQDKWVELRVGPFTWSIREITQAEADAWWEAHKPKPLRIQPMDLTVTELRDCVDILELDTLKLGPAIAKGITAFGAKATNYGALEVAAAEGKPVPVQPGFAIPMSVYTTFMESNGLWSAIKALMADPGWSDPAVRAGLLTDFQQTLRASPMDPARIEQIRAKVLEKFPGEYARFRSSTNSEDLGTFTGAGLYISETGQPLLTGSGHDTLEWAMKKVYAGIWNPRAYDERAYYGIDHLAVGMGLLVHPNFPDEEANGVAVSNNIFDISGLEPAFYVNAQKGSTDVVTPDPGILPDAYLQYFYYPAQPVMYLQHSTLIPPGETVLATAQIYELGVALDAVQRFYSAAYGGGGWYGLEVDWKFDDKYTPGTPSLFLKQARPYPPPKFGAAK
jgi:hypothetical protein